MSTENLRYLYLVYADTEEEAICAFKRDSAVINRLPPKDRERVIQLMLTIPLPCEAGEEGVLKRFLDVEIEVEFILRDFLNLQN